MPVWSSRTSTGSASPEAPPVQVSCRLFERSSAGLWPVFGTGTLPTGISVAFARGDGGLMTGLWHDAPSHKHPSGIPAWRTASRPVHDRQLTDALTGLRHGYPAYKHLRAIPAWQRGHLSALRHGTPAHKHLSGIPAWRRGYLSGLRHGDPAHRCLSGILAGPL